MSNVPTPSGATAKSSSASSPSRLRRDPPALLLDAKATAAAVTANLAAFEQADADRAVKRIDSSWLARYTSMLAAAETAVDGSAVRLGQLKAATATERANAQTLAEQLRAIRDDVTTSYPGDEGIGRAFGFGAQIDPKKTSALLALAGQLAGAFASSEWTARAIDAGVTQARIDATTALRAALSGADVSQQGLFATNADGTVQRDALLKALSGSTAYARKVAGVVLKGDGAALAAFEPVRGRAAIGAKAKASAAAATPMKTKAKKKVAPGKLRARRAEVKARAKALVIAPSARAAKTAASAKKAGKAGKKSAARKPASIKRAK